MVENLGSYFEKKRFLPSRVANHCEPYQRIVFRTEQCQHYLLKKHRRFSRQLAHATRLSLYHRPLTPHTSYLPHFALCQAQQKPPFQLLAVSAK